MVDIIKHKSNTVLGNSGFMYTETTGQATGYSWINKRTCIIKNIATGKEIFRLTGKHGGWAGRGTRATKRPDTIGTKKFLGLDNKYYYINVTYRKAEWGQIQPSGAVLKSDRTVLTTLPFYPVYREVPEPKPVIKNIPMAPKLIAEDKEKKSWIDNLIKQIQTLINRIINLLKN